MPSKRKGGESAARAASWRWTLEEKALLCTESLLFVDRVTKDASQAQTVEEKGDIAEPARFRQGDRPL